MAAHRGAIVFYVTNSGSVPGITTAHYDSNGDEVDDTAANADTVDVTLVGFVGSKFTGVAKSDTSSTFANRGEHDAGTYYVPA